MQYIIETKRKTVCSLLSVTILLCIFILTMYWLLAGVSMMLECLYSSHVSNEAQSIENINDRKKTTFFLMTKIIYILKL